MSNRTQEFEAKEEKRNEKLNVNAFTAGAVGFGSVVVMSSPALAQTSPVDDVQALVTSLAGITGAAITVILGAMGVRLAVKQLNRLMTKG